MRLSDHVKLGSKANSLTLLAVLSLSGWGTGVFAQIPGAVGQPQQRDDREDLRPPNAREAENYDPKGVRVGSFKLFPEIEVDEVYNDNIYATANSKQATFIQLIRPTVDLRSDWNNHMLNLYTKAGIGFYTTDGPKNNFQDVSVGANGRLDIERNWNIYGGASWDRRHEERGTPNTVSDPALPVTVYDQLTSSVGYFQKFNRFSARLDGRFDNFNYDNNGLGPAQGVIPNSDRNRNEWREALRLGYEFSPGYEIWARAGFNQRDYFSLDSSGFNRSSTGFSMVGGVIVDIGGLTAIEVFGGYLQQNFVDTQFANVRTPTFGLSGYWNPIRQLSLKPFVRRSVDDSALTTSAAYISTTAGMDVNYRVLPNVRLDGHADYSVADYLPVAGVPGNRYDQYYTIRAALMYMPTPNFFVGPSYQFVHRISNQFNNDYDQNVFMLRLGARL